MVNIRIFPYRSALFIHLDAWHKLHWLKLLSYGLALTHKKCIHDFDLSAVPLESNPQTFSSMALILEKCQTCCLLSEQIPYCSSRALQVPWPALTPHSSNHYCNSDKEGFRPATWEWPKQMRGRQGILGICQPKPPHAAFREPASGILGSGYLLADPQPETNFTWLESSHKGEFSGGKSLESSAE